MDEAPAAISLVMDWSTYFHEAVPELDETSNLMRRVLFNQKWQEKIEKRTEAFYQIICKLIDLMHRQVQDGGGARMTLWHDIPGYLVILGAFASASAFADGATWLDTVIDQLDHNRFMIKDLLAAKLPTVGYHIPHNSYLAWLDLESLNLGENPSVTLLERGRVAFNPGHTYGAQCSQYVRLNFATSPEIISEAIDRIVRTL